MAEATAGGDLPSASAGRTRSGVAGPTAWIAGSAAVLVGALLLAVVVGAGDVSVGEALRAVVAYDPASIPQTIVHDVRLPRVAVGAFVGAALALSGAIMQAITRNPLAEPGLMGLNAGASLALVLVLVADRGASYTVLVVLSFVGAAVGAATVYGIGSIAHGGLTPVRIALAGAAVSLMFTSLANGLALYKGLAEDILFYTAGGLSGVEWEQVRLSLPWLVLGIVGVLLIARQLTVMLLGEEVAAGLGQRTAAVKGLGWLLAVVLAGAAVAVAGPIGFVGLMVPHIARSLVGVDYRWVVPTAALLGAALIAVADVGARTVAAPREIPIGFVTALVGVPFFLYLARTSHRMG